jgi:trimeric autotransporter adhesin
MSSNAIALPVTIICILLIICFSSASLAQNVAINADGSRANANAILDIKSSNKGLLIPRLTSEARMKIPNTQGLLVYDINTNSFWYNTGQLWKNITPNTAEALAATGAWLVTGNAGTADVVNFLGTTDNVPLNIRVNNQQSGRIDHLLANTFWGYRSGASITTGNDNTGIGASALFATTTGFNNTAVGSNVLQSNTTGYHNAALGRFALMSNGTGFNNSAFGTNALANNTTGNDNTASGAGAMYSNNKGTHNVAVGVNALTANTAGSNNTATGSHAIGSNTTGEYNSAHGFVALANSTGGYNTANGAGALISTTTGNANAALGYAALYNNLTGSCNTAVGFQAITSWGHFINSTVIGCGAVVDASDKVRIGNAFVTAIEGQVPFTYPSDGRFKFQVQEDVKGLDFILQLRPVTYQFDTKKFDGQLRAGISAPVESTTTNSTWKEDIKPGDALPGMDAPYEKSSSIRRSGFIAQEVEQAAKKSGYNFSGVIRPQTESGYYTMSYDAFVVPIVKAIQEQQQVINDQQQQIKTQTKEINDLKKELAEIKKMLQNLK